MRYGNPSRRYGNGCKKPGKPRSQFLATYQLFLRDNPAAPPQPSQQSLDHRLRHRYNPLKILRLAQFLALR
ncbi:MAG: hypothetical protein HC890_03130 [Chloroflexaceae bacterium]|nr:hypothetical protein [Chloroflexaceae bacterium]